MKQYIFKQIKKIIGSNTIIKMNPIQFNKMLSFQRLISKWIVICNTKATTVNWTTANSLRKNRNRELYCAQLFSNQNESRIMQSNITARWYKIVPFIYNVRLIVIVIKINIYKLYQPLWKNCSYLSHLIILFRRFS